MSSNFITYKTYLTFSEALEVKQNLKANKIDSEVVAGKTSLGSSFGEGRIMDTYDLKIDPSNLEKVEEIIQKEIDLIIEKIPKDYYLFQSSNEELYDILLKKDEWNELDYNLAQDILIKRGQNIDQKVLEDLKKERLNSLAKPEKAPKGWILLGYIFSFLGGFIGIGMGLLIWTLKKKLPNGQKVYAYSDIDRQQGKIMFILGLIILPLAIMVRFHIINN